MLIRTLYLIRHGKPLIRERHTCGYAQDVPLSPAGLHQAEELRDWARSLSIAAVYTSPALRCVQTALILAGDRAPVFIENRLTEVDTGEWTGLSFDEIKERWPVKYAQRGQRIGTYPPPGGESFAQAGRRMAKTINLLLVQSEGDLVVVAHGGINRGWLCRLLGRSPDEVLTLPQPWGGVTEIQVNATRFCIKKLGVRPTLCPSPEEITELWERYEAPAPVRAHCEAVARRAMELVGQVKADQELLNAACLLHDLVRDRPDHARACGEIMVKEGWPVLGEIIASHHDLPQEAGTEANLLYLADKLVQEDRPVSLEERFEAKRAQCTTPEALAAWERRYRRAKQTVERLGVKNL